jgi:hypothetical protein
MELNFKKWFEVATSTCDVAVFSRPIMGVVRRHWPWTEEDPFFKKKRKKLEHYQDREAFFGDNDDPEALYTQQKASAKRLAELVALYNQEGSTGKIMQVSQKGEGYKDQRDSDQFALYLDGEEITEGDLEHLISRAFQICKELGII